VGDFIRVSTDGRRNEEPLTDGQKEEAKAYAVSLGMPEGRIFFSGNINTAYLPDLDALFIGTDVLPLRERGEDPNSNVSLKGAIAHEVVGHREADLQGRTQPDRLLEDVQASVRAARFAPDLSDIERCDLL
jgi:hypothetical protein